MRDSGRSGVLACVIGTMDLVRPLGLAGIRSAVVARPGSRVRYSRFTAAVIDWIDPWKHPEELVERLLAFGCRQAEKPVVYYEGDWDLLLVSRFRDQLAEGFRFVVPDRVLVEDLVDKARFQALAEHLALPVPRSRRFRASERRPGELDVAFPLVIKPLTRQLETWTAVGGRAKAVHVETPTDLSGLWPRLARSGIELLAQEVIPGPEDLIESYHAYVDERREVVGEFTGKKIRTFPAQYGHSSALVITASEEVAALGRELVARLQFSGVAKFDFKRDPEGRLRLLEVNPRFSLWHHPGAKAGVNIPALVYADLTGRPRGARPRARPGVRWCQLRLDASAVRAEGVPLARWLPWALTCEAKSSLAWDDPMPVVRGTLSRLSPGHTRKGERPPANEAEPEPRRRRRVRPE